ncbi:MAG: C4-dicarboxylate ABC transporter permease [Gemmatimonas sp. SG8_28]|jgi:TRAP-type C4-dicarboxylate transport system permease small subunit|nr:MAG: C4-dicarboxylate ABC transporter permease [Gemmatimonas sp. SG8_28]
MTGLTRAVDRAVGWLLVVLMGIAVLNVLWQVFTRFVLANPSGFTDELARYLLIWIGLLGASYAAGRNMHLAIDLLPAKLTGRSRWYLNLVIEASVFLFALAVLVVGGINLVRLTLTLGQTSAALHVPLGYVYLVLPLSGVLMMFFAVAAVFRHHAEWRGSDAIAGRSTEPH